MASPLAGFAKTGPELNQSLRLPRFCHCERSAAVAVTEARQSQRQGVSLRATQWRGNPWIATACGLAMTNDASVLAMTAEVSLRGPQARGNPFP